MSEYRDSLPSDQVPAYDAAVLAAGALWAQIREDLGCEQEPAAA